MVAFILIKVVRFSWCLISAIPRLSDLISIVSGMNLKESFFDKNKQQDVQRLTHKDGCADCKDKSRRQGHVDSWSAHHDMADKTLHYQWIRHADKLACHRNWTSDLIFCGIARKCEGSLYVKNAFLNPVKIHVNLESHLLSQICDSRCTPSIPEDPFWIGART